MRSLQTLVALFLGSSACFASAQTVSDRAERDQIVYMQDEAPEMRKAFEMAQSTLDSFLQVAASPPPNTSSFAVKVGIREGNRTEYFWLNEFTRSGDQFTGRINNQPSFAKSVKLGQLYTFTRARIVDWTYIDRAKRRTLGNFTACALLTREPPNEAEKFRTQYGLECG